MTWMIQKLIGRCCEQEEVDAANAELRELRASAAELAETKALLENAAARAVDAMRARDEAIEKKRAGSERASAAMKTVEDRLITRICMWMRGIPREWREDWGLNATEEIADLLASGLWLFDGNATESEGTSREPSK